MKKLLFILLFLPFTACTSNTSENQVSELANDVQNPTVRVVNADEFEIAMQKENVLIVDVRTDGEVAQGVIPGAIQLDFMNRSEFEKGVAQLDKNMEILVYCKVGGRSAKAAKHFEDQGFESIYDLKGGYDAWSAQGKQTEMLKK